MKVIEFFKALLRIKHYHVNEYPSIKTGVTLEMSDGFNIVVLGRDTSEVIQTLEAMKKCMDDWDVNPSGMFKPKEDKEEK